MIKIGKYEVKYNRFPNGELHIPIEEKILNQFEDYKHYVISWQYDADKAIEEWQVLKFIKRTIDDKGGLYGRLEMLYLPYSRMDRNEGGKIFTLKYFAKELNSLNFHRVEIIDPHSTVSEGLINKVKTYSHREIFNGIIENFLDEENKKLPLNIQLVFPDSGANKKYQKQYQDLVQTQPAIGEKLRDWETGIIKDINVKGVSGSCETFIIIDDICSKGGTFLGVAEKIKEKAPNSRVLLFVSHLEPISQEGILKSDLIDNIVTTNSMKKIDNNKITYLEVI